MEEIIIKLVQEKRRRHPKMGSKKLFNELKSDFGKLGFKLGRDKFIAILRQNSLLINRKKRRAITTNSKHWFNRYSNLIKDLEITRPNQVFVADITYIRVASGFYYLALVMDLYSRKIVGFDLSNSLSVEGSLRALKMALKNVKEPEKLIHHSDRGIQYSCDAYTDLLLKDLKVKISMTEVNHCYENAAAERLNGILKYEYLLENTFSSPELAKKSVSEAVWLYNEERPHLSLNYKKPSEVYAGVKERAA